MGAFDAKWFSGGSGSSDSYSKKKKDELATAAYNSDAIKKQEEQKVQDSKSVGQKAGDVAHGIGNFLHDAYFSVKNDAVGAYQGIGDVARGQLGSNEMAAKNKVAETRQKQWSEQFNNPKWTEEEANAKWKDPKFVEQAKAFTAETKKLTAVSQRSTEDVNTSQKVDAKKLAFQSASTFINATGLAGLAEAGVKTIGTQVAKSMAKDAIEQTIKTGGTDALEQIIKSGSKEAATHATEMLTKKVGEEAAHGFITRALTKAAPDALFGAGVGAVQTGEQNPNAGVGDYLKGAAIGGIVGGGAAVIGEGLSTAKKAITERAATKEAAQAATKDAASLLKLSPEDYSKQFGVPLEQAQKELDDLATNGTAIADKGIKAKIRNIFAPVKNFGDRTQQSFQDNAGGLHVAEVKSKAVVNQLKEAADQSGTPLTMDLAHQIENGTAPDNAFTQQFREIADTTRKEAVDAGLDIGYKENYVPHIWKQSEAEVDKVARGAGMKPRAGFERVIPTYDEGLKLGLKPKHTDPAKMMGDYVKNLETTRTNVALLTDLRDQGLLKTGRPPAGWKTVSAEGFPRDYRGNQLSAPKEVSRVLNNLYGNSDSVIDKALRKTAKFNSVWQDIALAGGIPHTPANFFTFSQMMKESALGLGQLVTGSPIKGAKTIYSPAAAFLRSFSDKRTQSFVKANSGLVEAMAKRGVPINFAETTANRGAKQLAKDTVHWDKLFNEPTFGRFMPNLQLNTARNVQNALEKKLGRDAALDATAGIMKKLYGITDQLATGRSQAVQDMIGTVAFAPKYRESILNVLANTVKSLNPATYGDKSFSLNRRLAVGMGVTYMLYDQLNKQTTGHGISKNPEGKDLSLAIPYGGKDAQGNQKVVYIPFMPSFMTLPRAGVAAVQGAIKGDQRAVASEGGKLLSMPIQVISQLATNKDYFGRPIYTDDAAAKANHTEADTGAQALLKQGGYLVGQAAPAGGRVALNLGENAIIKKQMEGLNPNSDKYKKLEKKLVPGEQIAATGLEAPVRFGKTSPLSTSDHGYSPGQVTSDWYDIYNSTSAKRRTVSAEVTDLVKQGKPGEAARKANEFNDTLNQRFNKYYKKYGQNPTSDKMWDEMLNSLAIKTSQRSFASRITQ